MKKINVLVCGAGGPAGWNFIKSLKDTGNYNIVGVDVNKYHAKLIENEISKCYLVPYTNKRNVSMINTIIKENDIDFVHAQPDGEVEWLGSVRNEIDAITYLPSQKIINICQDKNASNKYWDKKSIMLTCKDPSDMIRDDDNIWTVLMRNTLENRLEEARNAFGEQFWVRATHGAGGKGSSLCNVEIGKNWVNYWLSRGVDWEFIAEEYLPGKNMAVHMLWRKGELILAQGRERIEYIYPSLSPSGITGTPTVQVTSSEGIDESIEAVLTIDSKPDGLYCVDLKGNSKGVLIPTEINPGRLFTTSYFFTQIGLNIPDLYVRTGLGEDVNLPESRGILPDNVYYIRHLDMGNRIIRGKDLE